MTGTASPPSANGHPALDSGKPVSHFSGALEVTFDDERAEAADVQSSIGSDTPPDAAASALGCANRGSLTNPRLNQDCTLRRQAEEQVTVNPTDPTNVIAGHLKGGGGGQMATVQIIGWSTGWLSAFLDNVLAVATFMPIVHGIRVEAGTPYSSAIYWMMVFGGTFRSRPS